MAGVDKHKNRKLNLVAKVETSVDNHTAFVEAPSLRRVMMGKGKVYLYLKTDRGRVNRIYERRAYMASYVDLLEVYDKKLKRRFSKLVPGAEETTKKKKKKKSAKRKTTRSKRRARSTK